VCICTRVTITSVSTIMGMHMCDGLDLELPTYCIVGMIVQSLVEGLGYDGWNVGIRPWIHTCRIGLGEARVR
jgi:hypothetical protein